MTNRKVTALLIGLVTVFIAFMFCLFVSDSKLGYRIDYERLPPEAKAILDNNRGEPLTAEEWKSFRKILNDKKWDSGGSTLLLDMKRGWYWYFLLPLVGVLVFRKRYAGVVLPEALLLLLPCFVVGVVIVMA